MAPLRRAPRGRDVVSAADPIRRDEMPASAAVMADLVIIGARQLVMCEPDRPDGIGVLEEGGIAVRGGDILAVGTSAEILACAGGGTRIIHAQGGTVTPGLVDCHTHLIFAGDRSDEYFLRTQGMGDDELTASGAVWGVPASRAANSGLSAAQLAQIALPRARRMLAAGTTTLETKSGYALRRRCDLASLEAAQRVAAETGLEIVGTYLGAHARPRDGAERYLDTIISETIPAVAEQGLADFCDVYVDPDVFTVAECARVLRAGADAGLGAKLHTDARVNVGGGRLAAEMGAASVDHGNMLSDGDLRALADAGTSVAVFPGFDWAIGHRHPVDARRFRCAGVEVALGTDLCPVCWHLSQQTSMGFACRLSGLGPQEALLGVTLRAARAIRRDHRIGSLTPGKQADIVIFDVPDYRQLAFRFGSNAAAWVIKKGRVLVDGSATGFNRENGL